MRIRELILKNFGKFNDKNIELTDGIQVIYGENESGKSTLHTFIKGMFFGLERGRGRASANDTFTRYEPWENSNYYAGELRFESGGKVFRLNRHFDKYSKKAELICEDDGELLSIEDGDLEILLENLTADNFENTVSVGQLRVETGQPLAVELKNYATNYYATGNSEIDLEKTLSYLKEKKKTVDKEVKLSLEKKQQKRERIEQEASYVWRDVHRLEEERDSLREELEHRIEMEEEKARAEQENKGVIDEIRPQKWRIHPIELLLFAAIIVLAFVFIPRPWNYLVAIILFLICGLYVWNRMKVGKKQEKTPPEIMLEEITPEEEKIPIEKLEWEVNRACEELKEKEIQYSNLREQLAELDEVGDDYQAYDKKRLAIQLAIDRLNELSAELQGRLKEDLNEQASQIIAAITDGKYTRLLVEDNLHMSLMQEGKRIPMEQVSRGTVEQIYFALRMAAGELLHGEKYPIILDDTFVYYDDERMKQTLKWLAKQERQVILMTCHKREIKALEELGLSFHCVEI